MKQAAFHSPDLHMHSVYSDGTDTPRALLQRVRAAGLDIFALTDHDTAQGCAAVRALLALARRENVTDVLYDMKAIDPAVHRAYTGVDNALILDNLRRLAEDPVTQSKIRMRMPLIRGVNDAPAQIEAAAALYRQYGLRHLTLLPYHDLGVVKQRNIGGQPEVFQPPEEAELEEIQAVFQGTACMQVEILGRVRP